MRVELITAKHETRVVKKADTSTVSIDPADKEVEFLRAEVKRLTLLNEKHDASIKSYEKAVQILVDKNRSMRKENQVKSQIQDNFMTQMM